MSGYSQPILMNFNQFYLNLEFSLNWRWWEQRFFAQKPSFFADLQQSFKSRGIVRYFDQKSTKILNNLHHFLQMFKILPENERFALFSGKSGVKSGLVSASSVLAATY